MKMSLQLVNLRVARNDAHSNILSSSRSGKLSVYDHME